MFADRAKIYIRSGKAETVTSAFAGNYMFRMAVRTEATAVAAVM